MASRGARNLILLNRSGVGSEIAVGFMEELKANGVHAEAPKCDVTSADSLTAVLADCAKTMPPIKGCIQGSMVLRVCCLQIPRSEFGKTNRQQGFYF